MSNVDAMGSPMIGPYQLVRRLGAGGMGEVFLAYDERLDRNVAIKRLLAGSAPTAELRDRFHREARVAAKLNHPAIVHVYDVIRDGDVDCIVMEYVEGMTLRQQLNRGKMALRRIIAVGRQIAEAMAFAHESGVIHRDLKSENILLNRMGKVKITDFGIAKLAGAESLTNGFAILGTLRTMSPEQVSGRIVDHRTDLFSFGILMYEALTGRSPFEDEGPLAILTRILHTPHTPIPELAPEVPPALVGLVDRLLHKDPEQRPRDFKEVARALAQLAAIVEPIEGSVTGPILDEVSHRMHKPSEQEGASTDALANTRTEQIPASSPPAEQKLYPTEALKSLEGPRAPPTLRGRERLLDTLIREAEMCLAETRPVLSTIEAESGFGKTRLLHALAVALRNRTGQEVNYLRPRTANDSQPFGLARVLLRLALSLGSPASSKQPNALAMLDTAWRKLGVDITDASRRASAVLIGALERDAAELKPIMDVPGAFRQAAAQALARALTSAAKKRPLLLLVDDAHDADDVALDALELATMGSTPAPLGVWVAAESALYHDRPRWGDRAASGSRHPLLALDRDDADAVLRDMWGEIKPMPTPMMNRLYELSGGVPAYLAELAQTMRNGGSNAGDANQPPDAAVEALLGAGDTAFDQRLARQALQGLPKPLVFLVQLCALIGNSFTETEVRSILTILRKRGSVVGEELIADKDVATGLAQLHQWGILEREHKGYTIRTWVLRRAMEALIPAPRKRALHAAIAVHLERVGPAISENLAHHALRGGSTMMAVRIYSDLADSARKNHLDIEAERHYTSALEHVPDLSDKGRLLAERGRIRYRLQRPDESLEDLRRARLVANSLGDDLQEMSLLLEEATVLDWCSQWERAATMVERALSKVHRLESDQVLASLHLACGRTWFRRERYADAVELLTSTVQRAESLGDYELHVPALLLLAPALLRIGQRDEAARRFEQVVERCERAGDNFHLAIAYLHRHLLWMDRGDIERMLADVTTSRNLGRELGNAQLERNAAVQQAELLYRLGRTDEALELANASRDLYQRFLRRYPAPEEHLILARILCSRGQLEARAHLQWIESHCTLHTMPPSIRVLVEMVRLALAVLAGEPMEHEAWMALAGSLKSSLKREISVEISLVAAEVLYQRKQLMEARAWYKRAERLARGVALWQPRLAALAVGLTGGHRIF